MLLLGASLVGTPAHGQSKAVTEILKNLKDGNAATKIAACGKLGDLVDVKLSYAQMGLPLIRDMLKKETDANVRKAALEALGKIEYEPKTFVDNMLAALKGDKDVIVQAAAVNLLGLYGPEAKASVDALKEFQNASMTASKTTDPGNVRSAIVTALGQLEPGQNLAVLIDAVKRDEAASVRLTAINAIQQMQQNAKPAVPVLLELRKSLLEANKDVEVRRAILGALRNIDREPKGYLPALLDTAKKDKDPAVLATAATMLGDVGPDAKECLPDLLAAHKAALAAMPKDGTDPNNLRRTLLEALAKIDPQPKANLPVLMESLKKEREPGVRLATIQALAKIGPDAKESIATLKQMQEASVKASKGAPDPSGFRKAVLEALGKIDPDPKQYVPLLTNTLKTDRDPEVRMLAVKALGEIGAPAKSAVATLKALQKLPKTASEADKNLAKEAGAAIEKIQAK
jgi:HEAT repeat protein